MEFNPRFAYNVMGVFNSIETENPHQLIPNVIEVNIDEVEIPVIARRHFEMLSSENKA